MKKILFSLLIAVSVLLTSCLKENHSVCFKNNYTQVMYSVTAGNAKIGTVENGKVSNYYAINSGNFSISGMSSSGQNLSGSGSVSGRGTHKWTITLSSAGTLSISKDK